MAITEMINKRLLIYVYWWDSVVVCNQRYWVEGEVYQPQKYLGTACRSTKAWRTCIRNEALHKNTRLYPRKAKEFVSDVCWCDQPLRTVYSSASNWWPHFSKAAFEDQTCPSGATVPFQKGSFKCVHGTNHWIHWSLPYPEIHCPPKMVDNYGWHKEHNGQWIHF